MGLRLGVRGGGEFITNAEPQDWTEGLTRLFPYTDQQYPITNIALRMGKEPVGDPHFHWLEEDYTYGGGYVAGIYTNATLATALATTATQYAVYYAKMTVDLASMFRPGHIITFNTLKYAAAVSGQFPYSNVRNGEVISVAAYDVDGSGNGYVQFRLLTVDTAVASVSGTGAGEGSLQLQHVKNDGANYMGYCRIGGNAHAEGESRPESLHGDVKEYDNYTQIFRTSIDMTRTQKKVQNRLGVSSWAFDQIRALERHGVEMEMNFLFGNKYITKGTNGKPKRFTGGLIEFVKAQASGNVMNWAQTGAGKAWKEATGAAEDWLNASLQTLGRWGNPNSKVALAGMGAITAVNDLARYRGVYEMSVGESAYGTNIRKWINPVMNIDLIHHPLMTNDSMLNNAIIIYDPSYVKFKYMDDTQYLEAAEVAAKLGVDADSAEYLTEAGLKFAGAKTMGILYGLGFTAP